MSPAPGELPPTPLDPAAEALFGFGSDTWAARLKRAHENPAPSRLGPYEILGELGRGGQGEVYRAVQPGTGRIVALKRIAGLGLSPDPSLLLRFTREVEALTRLSHPNVVTVHTIDTVENHTILVMELVEGRHIDVWADAQWAATPEPLKAVLSTFTKACDGVAHAHQRGVIHRDIKPSNILVTGEGQPKVLDFGIARLLNEQAAAGAAPVWTVTGFAGTPAYASPEQLQSSAGGGIDTRSDVYSLGILLFRMLTGTDAFDTKLGLAARAKSAVEGPVRVPSGVRHRLPAECDLIIRKATDPEPERRYATVDALSDDVRRLGDGRPVLAHPPSGWYIARRAIRRRPWLTMGIAAATLAITILGSVAAVQAVRLSVRSRELAAALGNATRQKELAERGELRQRTLARRVVDASMATAPESRMYSSSDSDTIQVMSKLVEQLTPEDDDDTAVELHMRLAMAQMNSRKYADAARVFEIAQRLSDTIDAPTSERAARIAFRRSYCYRLMGKHAESLAVIDQALGRASGGDRTIVFATLLWERMTDLHRLGRPTEEVLACCRELIARTDEHPTQSLARVSAREECGYIARWRDRHEEAVDWFRQSLQLGLETRAPANMMSRVRHALAISLARDERWAEVEPLSRAAADFRIRTETASTHRAFYYCRLHAVSLMSLGRFSEAAPRWELALARPLARGNPDDPDLVSVRAGLASTRFALGQVDQARWLLALAISRGRTDQPADPAIAEPLARAESAFRANAWVINPRLRDSLGDLSWLINGLTFDDPVVEVPLPPDG